MMEEWQRERGRLGAAAMHAKYDGKALGARTMAGRMRHYEQQIDPTGALKRRDPQALARRVESAMQAAMQADMAKARAAKSGKKAQRLQAEAEAQERAARDAAHAYDAMREQLTAQLRQTPPNDIPQLAALVLALRALDEQPF